MTVQEAIERVDRLKPNSYGTEIKLKWLFALDAKILNEVFKTHVNCPVASLEPYNERDMNRELLVPFPYCDDIYTYWLESKIDFENNESQKYNQTGALFNAVYGEFTAWYNSTHSPIPSGQYFKY